MFRCYALFLLFLPWQLAASSDFEDCLSSQLQSSDESVTVGELRQRCKELSETNSPGNLLTDDEPGSENSSAFRKRFAAEKLIEERPFVITPHQPNYLLVSSWNSPSSASNPFVAEEDIELDDSEITFGISFKVPIWRNMFAQNVDAYFAYTAHSWWQLFNSDLSAPFRETNYEPELFVRSFTYYDVLGTTLAGWSLGINHQSNGRSEPLSRSWNRLLGRLGFIVTDDLTVMLRLWDRIDEKSDDDDNPDIEDFLGKGDVRAIWTPGESTFTAMLRNLPRDGAYELTWSYPLGKVFRFYTQYYNGYGESLIDYDRNVSRFSFGISVNDYLMNGSYQ